MLQSNLSCTLDLEEKPSAFWIVIEKWRNTLLIFSLLLVVLYFFSRLFVHSKTLPFESKFFVCREKEVHNLYNFLGYQHGEEFAKTVIISGGPGIGKSALAKYAVLKLLNDGVYNQSVDCIIYVDMDDMGSMNTASYVSSKIAQALGLGSKFQLDDWKPYNCRKILLIFDNWNHLFFADKTDLLLIVNKLSNQLSSYKLKMLITSREQKPELQFQYTIKYEVIVLNEFESVCACQLLKNSLKFITSQVCREIFDIVGGMPLALENIATYNHSVAELERDLIGVLSSEQFPSKLRVKDSIHRSYRNLHPEVQRIGRLLSHFPNGSFSKIFARDIIEPDAGQYVPEAIQVLVTQSLLVDRVAMTSMFVYDRVIRAFFKNMSTSSDEEELDIKCYNYNLALSINIGD